MRSKDRTCDEIYRKINHTVINKETHWVDFSVWCMVDLNFDSCNPIRMFIPDLFIFDRRLAEPE